MIKLSELQMKEVILIKDGRRLGFIDDLVIDPEKGVITALVIIERDMKNIFLKRASERIIQWEQIVTIGTDTILVESDGNIVEESEANVVEKK